MSTIIFFIIAATGIWIYIDATNNKIGKISEQKGIFNRSAGAWAASSYIIWPLVFPLYLIKRKSLKELAADKPIEASKKPLKVLGLLIPASIYALIGILESMPTPCDKPLVKLDGYMCLSHEAAYKYGSYQEELDYKKLFQNGNYSMSSEKIDGQCYAELTISGTVNGNSYNRTFNCKIYQ